MMARVRPKVIETRAEEDAEVGAERQVDVRCRCVDIEDECDEPDRGQCVDDVTAEQGTCIDRA